MIQLQIMKISTIWLMEFPRLTKTRWTSPSWNRQGYNPSTNVLLASYLIWVPSTLMRCSFFRVRNWHQRGHLCLSQATLNQSLRPSMFTWNLKSSRNEQFPSLNCTVLSSMSLVSFLTCPALGCEASSCTV